MGDFMAAVMKDPALRERGKEVQAFAGKLPQMVTQWTPAQRAMLEAGADEAAILRGSAPFLAATFGVAAVPVHAADDPSAPEHPKRTVAVPFRPGIALA